jgi:hypothetical protein
MLTEKYMVALEQTLSAYGRQCVIGTVNMDRSVLCPSLYYRVSLALVSDGYHVVKPLVFSGQLDVTNPSSDSSSSASTPGADRA